MTIYGRRLLKSLALLLYRPLRPILQAAGVDSKGLYEFAYWKSRQMEEGELANGWYEEVFTTRLWLDRASYQGKRVLDIGCGPRGSLEWADMAAERVGLDPLVPRYQHLGIDRHQTRYVAAAAEAIPYPSGYFDIVTSINSLDHVDDVDLVMKEMKRVLAPGGTLALIVEIHPRPTIAEPHALPWDLTRRFGPELEVVAEHHLEKPAGGGSYLEADTPFDHKRDPRRSGFLIARMIKPT